MVKVRKSKDRGQFDYGWLKTAHTFSFADYRDEGYVHFRSLRVINEDYIEGGQGFGMHPHRDMEIITYVMDGALKHKDSLGNEGVIKPGVVQRMSAGTGILHSEFNPLPDATTHLYQIWIFPNKKGIEPGWEEKRLTGQENGKLVPVGSPDGADGALTMQADARLFAATLEPGQKIEYELPKGHGAWVQVTIGSLKLNGHKLNESDGASIENVDRLEIEAIDDAEFLLFDLQ